MRADDRLRCAHHSRYGDARQTVGTALARLLPIYTSGARGLMPPTCLHRRGEALDISSYDAGHGWIARRGCGNSIRRRLVAGSSLGRRLNIHPHHFQMWAIGIFKTRPTQSRNPASARVGWRLLAALALPTMSSRCRGRRRRCRSGLSLEVLGRASFSG